MDDNAVYHSLHEEYDFGTVTEDSRKLIRITVWVLLDRPASLRNSK